MLKAAHFTLKYSLRFLIETNVFYLLWKNTTRKESR